MPNFNFFGFAADALFLLVPFLLLMIAGRDRNACKPRPGKITKKRVTFANLVASAFPVGAFTWRVGPLYGVACFKEAPTDPNDAVKKSLDSLTEELSTVTQALAESKKAMEKQFTELTANYSGVKNDSIEIKKAVDQHTAEYKDMVAKHQSLIAAVDQIKKELDAPIFRGGKDLEDADHKAAIELQKSLFLYNGGSEFDFKVDETKLVKAADYRSAAYKLMKGGLETKANIIRTFDDAERKAFEASGMDAAFFVPQMLGIEVDCNIECAEMLDLYRPITVSRSTFMYPKIIDYAAIGSYECDAKCDAELGPEGNLTYGNGKTYDFRGAFCLQKKTLSEANYDLLGFMMRSAARSYRINRNKALITGDGINEPLGWLTADCFTKIKTAGLKFDHVYFRRFMASCPVEYGPVVATMHQNMFAYLASMTDFEGRFIFGDGMMTFSPDDVRERIRISNCLPDATNDNTLGDEANPFVAGSFIMAAGNWTEAFAVVNKRPMFMEQYIGGSSAWCVKYQFGAEDGGFSTCCAAARTFYVGA